MSAPIRQHTSAPPTSYTTNMMTLSSIISAHTGTDARTYTTTHGLPTVQAACVSNAKITIASMEASHMHAVPKCGTLRLVPSVHPTVNKTVTKGISHLPDIYRHYLSSVIHIYTPYLQ